MSKTKLILCAVLLVAPLAQAAAKTPSARASIPRAYWGEWRDKIENCGNDEAHKFLTISAKKIGVHESLGTVGKVIILKSGGIKVSIAWPENGDHFPTEGIYRLSNAGRSMTETDPKTKNTARWLPCPVAR